MDKQYIIGLICDHIVQTVPVSVLISCVGNHDPPTLSGKAQNIPSYLSLETLFEMAKIEHMKAHTSFSQHKY